MTHLRVELCVTSWESVRVYIGVYPDQEFWDDIRRAKRILRRLIANSKDQQKHAFWLLKKLLHSEFNSLMRGCIGDIHYAKDLLKHLDNFDYKAFFTKRYGASYEWSMYKQDVYRTFEKTNLVLRKKQII